MRKVQMNVGNVNKYMEQGEIWAVMKVQIEIHELGDTPERKPASVDAKLAETSILPGSPTGCINLLQAGCSSAASDKEGMLSTI